MARRLPKDLAWTEVVLEHEQRLCTLCGMPIARKEASSPTCLYVEWAGLLCRANDSLLAPHMPEPLPDVRPRAGGDAGSSALADWLGRFLLAGSSPVFAALVGAAIACRVVGQLRDRVVGRCDRGLSSAVPVHVGSAQQDFALLQKEYATTRQVVLSIDGLQPEKGHETLYVVRELGRERVWFAQPLLSSATEEIRPLIVQAKAWAERLGCRVRRWMSDKQDAFVKTIASVCPGVPHRYCSNHFLRDLAKPVLELDSHAKVQMRGKIRGLRGHRARSAEGASSRVHQPRQRSKTSGADGGDCAAWAGRRTRLLCGGSRHHQR